MAPRSLRSAFAAFTLPTRVSAHLHLDPAATVAALDASIWSSVDRPLDRVERFLFGLVGSFEARRLRIMADPWPSAVRPEQVLWPTRLGRVLGEAGLLVPERLERLTYREFLALRSAGAKTALELGVIADALATPPPGSLDAIARKSLQAVAKEPWTTRVRGSDPRFCDVVPPYRGRMDELLAEALNDPSGRLARTLLHALPAVVARVHQIGSEPLDLAVARLRDTLGITERALAITLARLDRSWGAKPTLKEVAEEFSVSRERVRQIADLTVPRFSRTFLPQIERANQLLAMQMPFAADAAALALVEYGVSTSPIDPSVIEILARLLDYELDFHVDVHNGVRVVIPVGSRSVAS
ncbi:MAG TPA: sigma factor-like helix-turn-helix DNA-binding protein [Acidimicrobiales bacterium]